MRYVPIVLVVLLAPSGTADAQAPDARGVCVDNCGGSSSSSSTSSFDYAADARDIAAIKAANAARHKARQEELARRTANINGIAAFEQKNWDAAIRYFEQALERDPDDPLIAANLSRARTEKNAHEAASKAVAPDTPIEAVAAPIQSPAITVHADRGGKRSLAVPADTADWRNLVPYVDLTGHLASAREQLHRAAPDLKDFTVGAIKHVVTENVPGGGLVSFHDQFNDTEEMKTKYNELARGLVDEASRSAQEAVSILGGGDGSMQHVLDTPERMARMVNQFVEERLQNAIWGKIKDWGNGKVQGLFQDATAP